jgi:hypothetical protein
LAITGAKDETSAQPQVKLSSKYSTSLKSMVRLMVKVAIFLFGIAL